MRLIRTPRVDREIYKASARDVGFEVVNPALARQLERENVQLRWARQALALIIGILVAVLIAL